MNYKTFPTIFLIAFASITCAQVDLSKYNINIQKINSPPTIDGDLNDSVWQNIPFESNFTQFSPNLDTLPTFDTQFKVAYDDEALYFAAFLKDEQPDSILKELAYYDNVSANADFIGLFLDTYDDDQNGYGFFLSVSGVQSDARYSQSEGENWQWNAVWFSKTKVTDEGWFAEMKIPYFSIRFPEQTIQNWGINVWRELRRKRERSSWVPFDPNGNGFVNQWGQASNIKDIDAPLRLSLTPYISVAHRRLNRKSSIFKTQTSNAYLGGADIKYGINKSFTLDVTLIPDFGQAQSDDQVLNLTPFEVQFNENRGFFLEGTELFNIDGLFYSRRIGSRPIGYFAVIDSIKRFDTIIDNPTETQLINATKISGRTQKQTGIGIFNAITGNSYATIQNFGSRNFILTNPTSNYNIFVVDQPLKYNSTISFINTNVWRKGDYRDANVSSFSFRFNEKNEKYGIWGGAVMSNLFNENHSKADSVKTGYRYRLRAGKVSGKFQYSIGYFAETNKFDINDLGFLYNNNDNNWSAQASYRINDPVWKILNGWNLVGINYRRLYKPNVFTGLGMWGDHGVTWENWTTTGIYWEVSPFNGKDYFEPRVEGRYFQLFPTYSGSAFISTDYRKTFAIDISSGFTIEPKVDNHSWRLSISPRVRVNNQLRFVYDFSYRKNYDIGYLSLKDNDVLFSKRYFDTYENILNGSYVFTSRMALNLRVRHYWRKLVPQQLLFLNEDGTTSNYNYEGEDINDYVNSTNFFNIDLVYRWQFSPGSELSINWKNAISSFDKNVDDTFFTNLNKLGESPTDNNISLKVVYFLDYLNARKWLGQKPGKK